MRTLRFVLDDVACVRKHGGMWAAFFAGAAEVLSGEHECEAVGTERLEVSLSR